LGAAAAAATGGGVDVEEAVLVGLGSHGLCPGHCREHCQFFVLGVMLYV
jgi:hypothetical protein